MNDAHVIAVYDLILFDSTNYKIGECQVHILVVVPAFFRLLYRFYELAVSVMLCSDICTWFDSMVLIYLFVLKLFSSPISFSVSCMFA